MRFVAVLLVVFVCSGALASEPGTPLDCSDWVFLEPGYSCTRYGSAWVPSQSGNAALNFGANTQFDNQGRLFRVSPWHSVPIGSCGGTTLYRTQLLWLNGSSWTTLAYVDDRCVSPALQQTDVVQQRPTSAPGGDQVLRFDATGGRMILGFYSTCTGLQDCYANYPTDPGVLWWLAAISGFAATFDILQTYTPQSSLGFRVPYMPEGMAAADRFDTYWGNLTRPLDFTQAHGLQCDYPTAAPHVGDYLSVPDTVPTPAPGQGVYYVTSATYQGATRYGRKTTAGQQSGRDSALLPACAP